MTPFASFLVIHLEVGGDTGSLQHQKLYWQTLIDLVELADQYDAKLTLQFNLQWIEYLSMYSDKIDKFWKWHEGSHEIGLHHHGYDHNDWNGYTNRKGKNNDSKFRGNVLDMMEIIHKFMGSVQLFSGTITDEKYDYPEFIRFDTEGIEVQHARRKPKRVVLGSNIELIQLGMALLPWNGDLNSFKDEFVRSQKNEIFGIVTHELDFHKNPVIIEEWLKFVNCNGMKIKTVKEIAVEYEKNYNIEHCDEPLIFSKDVLSS